MLYSNVCIEAICACLPEEVITSAEIERRLGALYRRLHLPEGRLELISGIRERRLWPRNTRPSDASAKAGEKCLSLAGVAAERVDALFHCSVSRDCLEPATSAVVHRLLNLPKHAMNFDISNACLGVLSGMVVAAAMIEVGQIQTGLIVAGENSRPLLDATVDYLLGHEELNRQQIKDAFASLTIGSAAAAVVLTHRSISRTGHRFLGAVQRSNTAFHHLCTGGSDSGMGDTNRPLMTTDSEELLRRGIEVAEETWGVFKQELAWTENTPDLVCTHQVGRAHRERMYQTLGLDLAKDYATIEFLGNCGAASLPATVGLAVEAGRLREGQRLAMLGIGSGINCAMAGVQW